MSCLVVGATGLCGNYMVKHAPSYYSSVISLSRSQPEFVEGNDKATAIIERDTFTWCDKVKEVNSAYPDCTAFFSGLSSTRHHGGVGEQRKIDVDLNYDLARAAKEAGFEKYILVSTYGASSSSMFEYLKMKGELEDKVIALDFDQTIIMRPSVILGKRKKPFGNWIDVTFVNVIQKVYGTRFAKFFLSPVYGEEIAIACLKEASKHHDKKVVILAAGQVYDAPHANES